MIALIKIINIISGHIVQRKLVSVHSVMNKVTGVLLFILPLTFPITDKRLHHEIYLSDARKVQPEKLKTVIRHPIRKES